MKTKRLSTENIQRAAAWIFIAAGACLLFLGCEKKEPAPSSSTSPVSLQEQRLSGKWELRKIQTYEVSGTDSSGNLQCTLIETEAPDSSCSTQFLLNEYAADPSFRKGLGSIGGCNSISFAWKSRVSNKLETSDGLNYDILKCDGDSLLLRYVFKKDILTLAQETIFSRK